MIELTIWYQSYKDELNLTDSKYADVELTSDHAEQCVYTNDFIESQINGDDFDEWYSDVYPFCTGKSSQPSDESSIMDEKWWTPDRGQNGRVGWTKKVFANGLSRNRYNSLNQPPFGDFIPQQCRNLTIGWIVFVLLLGLFITIVNVLVITVLSRDSFYHNTYGSGLLMENIGALH